MTTNALNSVNLETHLADAKLITGVLNAAGYPTAIVGGALRVLALGGSTQDVDVAVLVEDVQDLSKLDNDIMHIVLPKLGYKFEVAHYTPYTDNDGFRADYRCENINIIAYDKNVYPTIKDLIDKFDLNINQFYIDGNYELKNDHFNVDTKVVSINPLRDGFDNFLRLKDRIQRFKGLYPELDWSGIEGRL